MCKKFECMWLKGEFSEEARPDRVGLYAVAQGDIAIVHIDPAKRDDLGRDVIEELRGRRHVLVKSENQITFLQGKSVPVPEKLLLEWVM